MNIKTLIIDDEASARSRLRKILSPFAQISIVGEACDGLEAVNLIERISPDLIFLDVQMPGLDGFEVLRALPAKSRWPLVIFATAFDQYALAAFEAKAVGYLLKPINRDKLNDAIARAEQLLSNSIETSEERSRLKALANSTRGELHHVVCKHRERFLLIPTEEVCFCSVKDNVTKIKTNTTLYSTNYRLSDLEERLPDPPFFLARRSVIVNLHMVREIVPMFKGSYLLILKDEHRTEIQVSERQSKRVRELLRV